MTDSEGAQDRAPTTEQIAAAGTSDGTDRTGPGQHPLTDMQTKSAPVTQAAAGDATGMGDQPRAKLLADDELQSILAQWTDI